MAQGQARGQGSAGGQPPEGAAAGQPPGQGPLQAGQPSPGNGQPGGGQGQNGAAVASAQRGAAAGRTAPRLTGGPERPPGAEGGDPVGLDNLLAGGEGGGRANPAGGGPITGGGYGAWSDRLRDVEEIVDSPDMRNAVAAARERARLLRQDYTRTLKKPDWAVIQMEIVKPLLEVRNHISDELARRDSKDSLVPIDRDPVPNRYAESVRIYYEELGKDK